MRPPRLTLAVVAASVWLAGCGIHDPLNQPAQPSRAAGEPFVRHDRPVGGAARSPQAAVERFARLYINWTHDTLVDVQRRLAAISVGEASSTQARAAAHTPEDYELRRGKIANHGRIVALAPALPSRTGRYVLVTVERTTGAGVYEQLRPATHVTYATVVRVPGGWAVSKWEPQI